MTRTPGVLKEEFPWSRPAVDPPDAYAWLREEAPIRRVELSGGQPGWLVTRYDDVRAILLDPRVSSDTDRPGFPHLGRPMVTGENRSFLRLDEPDHTVLRRTISKNFMVKRVQAMRPRIQELVDAAIDDVLAAERPVDLVERLALPVPSTVLAWLLGVPPEDREFFNKASEDLLNASAPDRPNAYELGVTARAEIREYLTGLAAERSTKDDPGEDIIGQLIGAERAGTISRQDTVNTAALMLVAGHETTANMTALGTLTLLRHPDQMAELRENPELLPNAIEELLRYLTIVQLIVLRVATEDIEIAGQTIPAGEAIIPLNFAANRDDAHFPRADEFDIHRQARDHLAFGFGIHQCLGQPLARVELQVIFETLLRRIPTLRLAAQPEDLPFKFYAPVNGLFHLPVTW